MTDLLVVGSVALDTIETPHGRVDDVLGGSAVNFALSARHFARVSLVGIVGHDFPRNHIQRLQSLGVDTQGIRIVQDGLSFRWHGRYEADMNKRTTVDVKLNVFGQFRPEVPPSLRAARVVLLGNASPHTQMALLDQLQNPELVLLDTMDLWIQTEREALENLLPRVSALTVNLEEALVLTGETVPTRAARKLLEKGPRMVVIKKGEHGAILATARGLFVLPAFPTETVLDPTGAGDAFAGGFLGHLAQRPTEVRRALAYGNVMGSFAVEAFGVERLASLTRSEIDARLRELEAIIQV